MLEDAKDQEELKYHSYFFLMYIDAINEISMEKSTIYLSGLLLLYCLTGLYFDLFGMLPSSNDISLPRMDVYVASLLKWIVALINWWKLSPSLKILLSGYNAAHIIHPASIKTPWNGFIKARLVYLHLDAPYTYWNTWNAKKCPHLLMQLWNSNMVLISNFNIQYHW